MPKITIECSDFDPLLEAIDWRINDLSGWGYDVDRLNSCRSQINWIISGGCEVKHYNWGYSYD